MKLRDWLTGCANSALKQAGKLGLVWFGSLASGVRLDWRTLVLTVSVGFLWGFCEFISANGAPDLELTVQGPAKVNIPDGVKAEISTSGKIVPYSIDPMKNITSVTPPSAISKS